MLINRCIMIQLSSWVRIGRFISLHSFIVHCTVQHWVCWADAEIRGNRHLLSGMELPSTGVGTLALEPILVLSRVPQFLLSILIWIHNILKLSLFVEISFLCAYCLLNLYSKSLKSAIIYLWRSLQTGVNIFRGATIFVRVLLEFYWIYIILQVRKHFLNDCYAFISSSQYRWQCRGTLVSVVECDARWRWCWWRWRRCGHPRPGHGAASHGASPAAHAQCAGHRARQWCWGAYITRLTRDERTVTLAAACSPQQPSS